MWDDKLLKTDVMEGEWSRSFHNMAHNKISVNRIATSAPWLRKAGILRRLSKVFWASKTMSHPEVSGPSSEPDSQGCKAPTGHSDSKQDFAREMS